jgi:hypothetical protein
LPINLQMSEFVYVIATTFPSGLDMASLKYSIVNSNLAVKYEGYEIDDTNITLLFNPALSVGEQSDLSSIIAGYTTYNVVDHKHLSHFMTNKTKTDSSDYVSVATNIYLGSFNSGVIKKIEVVAWSNNSARSFDIKIIDQTNMTTIVEKTNNTNTSPMIIDMGVITNCPINRALLILLIRDNNAVINTDFAYINDAIIYT